MANASGRSPGGPAGTIRAREAKPRLLGVHAAIQIEHAVGELPLYVPRDLDENLHARVAKAAEGGGFILLTGSSSVGKTRTMFEAVRAVLPEWWLLHPASTDALRQFAAEPYPRTVVWLDELQRYLNGPAAVTAGTLRDLITVGAVLAATMWTDEYRKQIALPVSSEADLYADSRNLLRIADVLDVPDTFSPDERRRAAARASDPRIRIAWSTADAGFTQVIAAGPELVRWWEHASDNECYGKAIISAALDARRVGARAPLTRNFLEAAAPGYLTDAQQAKAPEDWLDNALDYATTLLHGATSTLRPIPAGMGQIAGYDVADYLHQHAMRVRRTTQLPDIAWRALVTYHLPEDAWRLAFNAENRGRYPEAIALYRRAAETGDKSASDSLTRLLAEHGHLDELTQRADAGDSYATTLLTTSLIEQGRIDDALAALRRQADTDDHADRRLAALLAEHGHVDELTRRAHAGSPHATKELTEVLTQQNRTEEAISLWRELVSHNVLSADRHLAILLAKQGHFDELTQRASAGEWYPAQELAKSLAEQGHIEEALTVWRERASTNTAAADALDRLLADHNRIDELTQRADADDLWARIRLAALLAKHGNLEELTERADAGDMYAAEELAKLHIRQGRPDDAIAVWHRRADAGLTVTANHLAEVMVEPLASQGRLDDALAMLRPQANAEIDGPDERAGAQLASLLAKYGRVDELTERANAGSRSARNHLADFLTKQGRLDEALSAVYRYRDWEMAEVVAEGLAQDGRIDDAVTILRLEADSGHINPLANRQLVSLLIKHRRINDLIAEVATGTPGAAKALHQLTNRSTD